MTAIRGPEEARRRLSELGRLAREQDVSGRLVLLGGAALLLAFRAVRWTDDIDYIIEATTLPLSFLQSDPVRQLGLHPVSASLFMVHDQFETMLRPLPESTAARIMVYTLDEYNLVFSKLVRNDPKDYDDVCTLCRDMALDPNKLMELYANARRQVNNRWWGDKAFEDLMNDVYGVAWRIPKD